MKRLRRRLFLPFFLLALVAVAAAPSASPAADAASGDGWGPGAWGTIPAPADSVRARFTNRPVPLWERAVNLPHDALRLVLHPVVLGLGTGVTYLDERAELDLVRKIVAPRIWPFDVRLNFQTGGLVGPAAGFSARSENAFLPESKTKIGVRFSENGNNKATFGIRHRIGEDAVEAGFGYRVDPNARYFGLGPRTDRSRESYYTQEVAWAGASYTEALGARLAAEGFAVFSGVGASGPSEEEDPKLDVVFAGALPLGWRDRSDGFTLGAALTHDTTRETGRPESGGLRRAVVSWFTSSAGPDASFLTWRLEAQQFLPLWFSRRSLALRALITRVEPGNDPVPFQRLLTNDDPDLFRGYNDFRWRDRGLVAASVEYRWPVWAYDRADGPGVDAYLLADFGQVFDAFDDIAAADVTTSVGVGLRLVGFDSGFVGRIDYGRSEEGSLTRVRGDQVFQYAKGGFYDGRSPIPTR